MRLTMISLAAMALLALSGCHAAKAPMESADSRTTSGGASRASAPEREALSEKKPSGTAANQQPASAAQSDAEVIRTSVVATERKIIRNAELTIEVESPTEAQRRIERVAEARGGFVVTSETRRYGSGGAANISVTVVLRVPAAQFAAALDEIRGTGSRIQQEKITGQDVTEEYIDLEARIRAKKALEAQFLEIMKQATRVPDALEVQRQLAEVRTEIERLEGRRRYLENQSSLSTITVNLQAPAPLVAASGPSFIQSVKEAFGDAIDIGIGIITGFIRLIGVLVPIALLIGLPLFLLIRYAIRRLRQTRAPQPGA
jgi:hypothetical protein